MLAVIVSFRFPVVVPVPNTTVPSVAPVVAPLIVQFWTVSPEASPMKRIVAADASVRVVDRQGVPAAFTPSIVTLSAPLRSISGRPAVAAPEIVRAAPPTGLTEIVV